MGKLRYIVPILLLISLLASSSCALIRESSSSHIPGEPIKPDWQPVYIDEEVGSSLTEAELVERIAPSVVSIFTEKVKERGAGSGVIIDPEGYVVTNSHVVEGAESVKVVLSDGRSFEAVKWAIEPWTDLAVVKIKADGLPVARFLRNSLEKLKVLEDVVAVGNAYALPGGPSWTEGCISNLGRSIQLPNDIVLHDLIQTDAAINPGNSGGPLVNRAGQVVGINTAIIADPVAQNMGFAISTDTAIPAIHDLITKGYVPCAWLGVRILTVTPEVKSQYNLSVDYGALIVEMVSDSPADTAGLREGDIITKFDDEAINTADELVEAIRSHQAGDTVTISFVRGQERKTTTATLIQRPPP